MTDLGWQALNSAALVGTARRPVPAAATGIRPRSDAAPEVDLLDQAALVGVTLRASRQPERLSAPGVAPADEAQEPTALQAQLLAVSAQQSPAGATMRTALLTHWCHQAARAGVHAPAALLPDLLERATADQTLRPALRGVLDRRGWWLAAQNPVWAWAAAADASASADEADWEHLPSAQRPTHLRRLRATDPGAARDLLAGTWSTESAKERALLLSCLDAGLTLDDEALLEQALDDPAGGVRQQAVILLCRLPGAARAARMRARLVPLVTQRGLLRKVLTVELPDAPDKAAVRDGLGKPPLGLSERGWWLHELITGTPLSFWSEVAGAEPAAVVSRVHQNDVLRGLVSAAVAQQDRVWAQVLLANAQDGELSGLLGVLPEPVLAHRAVGLLPGKDIAPLRRILRSIGAFGPDLSRQLVASMSRPMPSPRFVLLEQDLVRRLHPACQPELLQLSRRTDLTEPERRIVGDLVQLHSVQQSISEAFS